MRLLTTVLALTTLGLSTAGSPSQAANIFWANPSTGDWSNASNWNPAQVPGPADVAFINVAGTYLVDGDVPIDVQRIFIGNLTGGQTLIIDGQTLDVSTGNTTITLGGSIRLRNGTVVNGTGTINANAVLEINDSTINNIVSANGTIQILNACAINGPLSLGTASTLDFFSGGSLTVADGFTANGSVLLDGSSVSLDVTTGTLGFGANSVVTVSGTGLPRSILAQIDNQGVWNVSTDLSLDEDSAAHVNSGSINVSSDTLTINQTGTSPSFANSGSFIADGDVIISGGTFTNSATGTVGGGGSLDVSTSSFTNEGTLSPGSSAGTLDVAGDVNGTSTMTLEIELGGTTPGSGHDQLAATGAVSVGGTLDVSTISGFFPSPGDSFVVVTAGSLSGTFADTTSLELGGGIALETEYTPTSLVLHAVSVPLSDNVRPVDPGVCVTPFDTCLTIPFEFERTIADPVRAFTVTFELSPELELCDGLNSIAEGSYLSDFCGGGCTLFQKNDNGDGTYTVDAAILGATCGPIASGGTLFTVDVTDSSGDGTGLISVTSVTVRDCSNAAVAGEPGPPLSLDIDLSFPVAIVDLGSAQIKTGNDTDGTTDVQVDFSGAEPGATVEVYRKGHGDYPEYDAGAVPAPPTDPADALANGWALTGVSATGELDEVAARDYYYYTAFVISPCGLISGPSNLTGGTLNYHLGDVSDGVTPGDGDNDVASIDVSLLGANYFASGAAVDSVNYLDVGPTDDFSTDGLPTTDDVIGFEDLLMFAINFGTVDRLPGGDALEVDNVKLGPPALVLERVGSGAVRPGGLIKAELVLEGRGRLVKGAHAEIAYDSKLELVSIARTGLADVGHVFQDHLDKDGVISIDTAVMGTGATFEGPGALAELVFRVEEPGFELPGLVAGDLRGIENQPIEDVSTPEVLEPVHEQTRALPARTQLLGARPSPFSRNTSIAFALSAETETTIRIFGVDGRLVRDLHDAVLPAGEHQVGWDGTDRNGHQVGSGVYFYTFQAGDVSESAKIFVQR